LAEIVVGWPTKTGFGDAEAVADSGAAAATNPGFAVSNRQSAMRASRKMKTFSCPFLIIASILRFPS